RTACHAKAKRWHASPPVSNGKPLGELFHPTAGGDVGKPDLVGEGGDEFVAAGGEVRCGTAFVFGEARKNQQAATLPFRHGRALHRTLSDTPEWACLPAPS